MPTSFLSSVSGALLCLAAGVAHGVSSGPAPASTAGLDIVLTIEHTESSLPGGFPTTGAVTQTYAPDGTYVYSGFGGPNHLAGTGTYTYTKTGRNTASEDAIQYSKLFTLPYHMEYTFVTPNAGRWKQYFANGLIVFEGSFATSPSNARVEWAPENLDGRTLLLWTARPWDHFDLSTVTHGDSSYRAVDAGSNHIETGTYEARRMSSRSLVEELMGPDQLIVRSLTFTTRSGGVWKGARLIDGARSEGIFVLPR